MKAGFAVSAGDEDVAVSAGREKIGKVQNSVVRVIEQEQPLFASASKPANRIVRGVTYRIY
jgi:hypothetical protein